MIRNWLPISYLEAALYDKTGLHEIPYIPGFLIYLAESRYAYYEANSQETDLLDPRRKGNSIQTKDATVLSSLARINAWKDEIISQIGLQYDTFIHTNNNNNNESIPLNSHSNSNLLWLQIFKNQCIDICCRYEVLKVLRQRSTIDLQLQYENLTNHNNNNHSNSNSSVPDCYKKVLELLQQADRSGLWPLSS